MGLFETSLMLEELSRISGGVYMGIFAHTCLSSYVIERNGNADQKAKFLPGLVSGQTIGKCFNSGTHGIDFTLERISWIWTHGPLAHSRGYIEVKNE